MPVKFGNFSGYLILELYHELLCVWFYNKYDVDPVTDFCFSLQPLQRFATTANRLLYNPELPECRAVQPLPCPGIPLIQGLCRGDRGHRQGQQRAAPPSFTALVCHWSSVKHPQQRPESGPTFQFGICVSGARCNNKITLIGQQKCILLQLSSFK